MEHEERELLGQVLVPIATEKNALTTARALEPYRPNRVTAIHVVEKGEGVPDKTPVEQSEAVADESFAAVQSVFPDADERTAYRRDVVGAVLDIADEIDASAIAFCPRGGNRLVQFLSGDRTLKLVTRADLPVVALPHRDDA